MLEALEFEFMRNAIIAGLLASLALGVIGTLVVVNREVFISGGIAHAAYGGVGIGFYFGIDPVLGALAFAVVAALFMGIIRRLTRQRTDTIIGVIWAVGMAVGIIFIDLTPGYKSDLMSYLFGSILAVSRDELWLMVALDVLIVAFVTLFYRPLVALSFDETFARVRNIPVVGLQLALLAVIALTVVMLMQVVGLILVIAMLTIPPALSSQFLTTIRATMVLSVTLAALFTLVGLAVAYEADLTTGATIILVAAGAFLVATGARWLAGLQRRAA
jgi:zinc transport system permease protein